MAENAPQLYDMIYSPFEGDYSTYGQNVPGATAAHQFYDYVPRPQEVAPVATGGALAPIILPEDLPTADGGGDGGRYQPKSGSGSTQGLGRAIAETFGQPQQTSAYGVTDIHPLASMISALFPGGTMAMGGLQAANMANVRDVQGSLGLDKSSMWNALNPFSRLARGKSDASLGKTNIGGRDYGVSFGGLIDKPYSKGDVTADFTTSLTPDEALKRVAYSKYPPKPKPSAKGGASRSASGKTKRDRADRAIRESIGKTDKFGPK